MCDPLCDIAKCGYDNYECEGSPHTHPYSGDDTTYFDIGFKAAEDTSFAAEAEIEAEAETETEIKKEENSSGYSIWAILVIAIVGWMAYKKIRKIKSSGEANKISAASVQYARL